MANNKSIQFLRKTSGGVTDADIKSLLPGQPLVDFPNKRLFIGTPTSASNPSSAIIFDSTPPVYTHFCTLSWDLEDMEGHYGTIHLAPIASNSAALIVSSPTIRAILGEGTLLAGGEFRDGRANPILSINIIGDYIYINYLKLINNSENQQRVSWDVVSVSDKVV